MRTTISNIIVDTRYAKDCRKWETAISKDNGQNWDLLEWDTNKASANLTHLKVVNQLK